MKHVDRDETSVEALLRSTRTIAVIGASPRPERHSGLVVSYLHKSGYDVIPIRLDRATVGGLPTFARLDDFGGSVDLVVIFRRPEAVPDHIREAAGKRAEAVWLPPGTWSPRAAEEAEAHHVVVVKDRCLMEEHQHLFGAIGEPGSGHPGKQHIHVTNRRHHG
jgi:uncharacterized protein